MAEYIQVHQPGLWGFSAQNIWRMRQFFEAYQHAPKLSTLLRELPWSSNLHIKLNFYLEVLDRDHRKPHENPSIGVLLCASKDLIRNMSQLKRHTRKDAGIQCQGW